MNECHLCGEAYLLPLIDFGNHPIAKHYLARQSDQKPVGVIRELTQGRGADYTIEQAFDAMRRRGGGSDPDRDIPIYANLYLKGKLPLDKLITHRYSLDNVNQALDDLEQNQVVRPLIAIDSTLGEVI